MSATQLCSMLLPYGVAYQITGARQSTCELMKKSSKAILMSALICPGAGQIYLKKYLVAMVLMAATAATLYVLLVPVFAIANEMVAKILSGELQAGPNLIGDVLAATQNASAMQSLNIASLMLIALWLIGVIHAWRAGKILEQ